MDVRIGLLTAALLLNVSRAARADPFKTRPFALELDGQFGWVDGRHSGGLALGGSVRLNYGILTAGVSLQGATVVFQSMGSASTVAGLTVPISFIRLDALAELGFNRYVAVGSDWSGDPGANATLPFAGARGSLLLRIYHDTRGTCFWLGPGLHYAKDLHSTTLTYSYRDQGTDWLNGASHDQVVTETVRFGQSRTAWLGVISATGPL